MLYWSPPPTQEKTEGAPSPDAGSMTIEVPQLEPEPAMVLAMVPRSAWRVECMGWRVGWVEDGVQRDGVMCGWGLRQGKHSLEKG